MAKCSKSEMQAQTGDESDWINRVVLADCLDALAEPLFPQVDLVHTSPPYNIDKPYAEFTDQQHLGGYLAFVARVARALSNKIRIGGSLFWQTGYTRAEEKSDEINPIDVLTYQIFHGHGFYLKDRIIWRYYGGMSFKSKFKNQHETIYWYVRGDPKRADNLPFFDVDEVRESSREYDPRNNILGRNPGNVWEVDRVAYGSTEQTSHIAVFPEEISERIIRACTRPGDLVLDPFLGSGTVAKVGRSLGRRYIGIEISRPYHGEAMRRLGYQQFGEPDTVLSEWIKQYLLSMNGRRKRNDIMTFLDDTLAARPSEEERRVLDAVKEADSGGSIPKPRKPALWRMTDDFVGSLGELITLDHGPVANIVRAYLRNYRLARCFNGLRLLITARRIMDAIKQEVTAPDGLKKIVDRVLANEPSSFETKGATSVVLKEDRRRIKPRAMRSDDDARKELPLFAAG